MENTEGIETLAGQISDITHLILGATYKDTYEPLPFYNYQLFDEINGNPS